MLGKGLVFGKFLPVHAGHLALIAFAAARCQRLVVSMSIRPDDPIDPALRLGWLRTLLADHPQIEVVGVADDFSDDTLPLEESTRQWADFIRRRFPDVDAFFCSEAYGEPLARHLGRPGIMFDMPRQQVPVAASLIRRHPLRYWAFIPAVEGPISCRKYACTGPRARASPRWPRSWPRTTAPASCPKWRGEC